MCTLDLNLFQHLHKKKYILFYTYTHFDLKQKKTKMFFNYAPHFFFFFSPPLIYTHIKHIWILFFIYIIIIIIIATNLNANHPIALVLLFRFYDDDDDTSWQMSDLTRLLNDYTHFWSLQTISTAEL